MHFLSQAVNTISQVHIKFSMAALPKGLRLLCIVTMNSIITNISLFLNGLVEFMQLQQFVVIFACLNFKKQFLLGSRAGANAAVAWATLLSFGRQTYVMRCRRIIESAKRLADGINKIPGLQV